MTDSFPFTDSARPPREPAFTIRSRLGVYGSSAEQTQYACEAFVVTKIGRSAMLFMRSLHSRFLIDRGRRELRHVDPLAQKQHVEQIRMLLGDVQIDRDDRTVVVNGQSCRTIRVKNRDARLVLSVEAFCARVEGLQGTALGAERVFDAAHQPFAIPLDDDEIVVRSTTRALAANFGQSQTLDLVELTPTIVDPIEIRRVLHYRIADR